MCRRERELRERERQGELKERQEGRNTESQGAENRTAARRESSGFNSWRERYRGALCGSLRKQMWLPVGGVGQASGRRWHFPCAS